MSTAQTSFVIHSGTRVAPLASVEVAGQLDVSSAPGFRSVMRDFIGDPYVTVDLSRCSFIDSAGVSALVGALRRIREAGGIARVVAASATVRFALRAASADSLLNDTGSRASAAAV